MHTTELKSVRQPVGVVLGIAPWNAPIILAIRAIAAPLACGNTIILKASEISPGTQALLGQGVRRRRFSAWRVVNVIGNAPADAGKVVELLIAHPAVGRVNFTGSTRAGRIIAETAGSKAALRNLTPSLASELSDWGVARPQNFKTRANKTSSFYHVSVNRDMFDVRCCSG